MALTEDQKKKLKEDPKYAVLSELFDDHLTEFFAKRDVEDKKKKDSEPGFFDSLFGG